MIAEMRKISFFLFYGSLHCWLALQLASNLAWNIHHHHSSLIIHHHHSRCPQHVADWHCSWQATRTALFKYAVFDMWLTPLLTDTAVGQQPGLEHSPSSFIVIVIIIQISLKMWLTGTAGTAVGKQPGLEHTSSSFIVIIIIIIIYIGLNMWLTGTAVGQQPGVEHLLLQAAQPQPGPQVCLHLLGPAVCNHHHFPLDPAIFSCAATACVGLGCAAVLLEPQRVAQQQGGHS